MSEHAFLPPSGAAQWVVCHAAPALWERYPELLPRKDAPEGLAAHWVIEQLHAVSPVAVGSLAANGLAVTQAMLEGAGVWFQALSEWGDLAEGAYPPKIEQRVTMTGLVHAENWGTPDLRRRIGNTLRVRDFKFGHDFVDAFGNWQLIDYAAGGLEELGYNREAIAAGHCDIVVDMGIVQPRNFDRSGPIRRWQMRADQLLPYFDRLAASADAATAPNAKAVPGPQCKNCSARRACSAVQREAYTGAEEGYQSLPLELSPEQLGVELRLLTYYRDLLNARVTGLEEQAEFNLRQGQRVPGVHMEPGQGKTDWTKPPDEIITLGSMLGVDLRKPAAITPKQAQAKGLPAEVVDAYSVRIPGAMKLAFDDATEAAKVFSIQPKE